jgi:hypothetical protein
MMDAAKPSGLVVAVLLACGAPEAWAARQAPPQAQQLTQGWVVGVQRANGQPAFRVRTSGMGNQRALAANLNGAVPPAQNLRTFLVGPGTQFETAQPVGLLPTSFGALRTGQRVLIASQGPQAFRVRIFPHYQHGGYARRARGAAYPTGLRHASHVPPSQTPGAVGANRAVQTMKTPRANHPIHNASAVVKSRKH